MKVFPIEKASTTYWIPLSNDENTALLVNKLESISGDLLVACEMVSSNVLKATNENYSELNSKIVIPYVKDQVDVLFVEFATTLENDDIKNKGEEILAKLVELLNQYIDIKVERIIAKKIRKKLKINFLNLEQVFIKKFLKYIQTLSYVISVTLEMVEYI